MTAMLVGTFCFRDFNCCDAYAAAGCCDENEVFFFEMTQHDEAAVCGEVLHPDGGTFFVGELGRVFGECCGRDDGDFAVDTVCVEAEEAGDGACSLADPCRIHAGADGFDDAGGLVAVLRWEDRSFEVLAVAEHHLGTVEAESFDAETNFSVGGFGERELVELKDFWAACFVEANELYGIGHAGSWDRVLLPIGRPRRTEDAGCGWSETDAADY